MWSRAQGKQRRAALLPITMTSLGRKIPDVVSCRYCLEHRHFHLCTLPRAKEEVVQCPRDQLAVLLPVQTHRWGCRLHPGTDTAPLQKSGPGCIWRKCASLDKTSQGQQVSAVQPALGTLLQRPCRGTAEGEYSSVLLSPLSS